MKWTNILLLYYHMTISFHCSKHHTIWDNYVFNSSSIRIALEVVTKMSELNKMITGSWWPFGWIPSSRIPFRRKPFGRMAIGRIYHATENHLAEPVDWPIADSQVEVVVVLFLIIRSETCRNYISVESLISLITRTGFWYDVDTIPLRFRFDSDSVSRSNFNTISIFIRGRLVSDRIWCDSYTILISIKIGSELHQIGIELSLYRMKISTESHQNQIRIIPKSFSCDHIGRL